jgi:hypothetical protein
MNNWLFMRLINGAIAKMQAVLGTVIIVVLVLVVVVSYTSTLPKTNLQRSNPTDTIPPSSPTSTPPFTPTSTPPSTPTSSNVIPPSPTEPAETTTLSSFTGLNVSISGILYPTTTPAPIGQLPVTPIEITFSDALSSGLIKAKISETGGCSGDCIIMNVERTGPDALKLTPPSLGTVLVTREYAQNMVIFKMKGILGWESLGSMYYVPDSFMTLTYSQKQTYLFGAYSLDFNKPNPSSNAEFFISGTANSSIIKILNTLNHLNYDSSNIIAGQLAIWAVTDNIGLSELANSSQIVLNQVANAKNILITAGIDISNMKLFS